MRDKKVWFLKHQKVNLYVRSTSETMFWNSENKFSWCLKIEQSKMESDVFNAYMLTVLFMTTLMGKYKIQNSI